MGVGWLRTIEPPSMAYGDPGAWVKDPSAFTNATTKLFDPVVVQPKINGAVVDATIPPPLRNGLVLLSISVSPPSWIRKVPAEEYRYVLVESMASAPEERTGGWVYGGWEDDG